MSNRISVVDGRCPHGNFVGKLCIANAKKLTQEKIAEDMHERAVQYCSDCANEVLTGKKRDRTKPLDTKQMLSVKGISVGSGASIPPFPSQTRNPAFGWWNFGDKAE